GVAGAARAAGRRGGGRAGVAGAGGQLAAAEAGAELAAAAVWTRSAEPGDSLNSVESIAGGPKLTDVLDPAARLELTVHQDFDWWVPVGVTPDPQHAATIEQAKQAGMPSARAAMGADVT